MLADIGVESNFNWAGYKLGVAASSVMASRPNFACDIRMYSSQVFGFSNKFPTMN